MNNFLIILISIISGVLIRKFKILPKDSHKVVNLWVISVALPSISLLYIPKMQWNWDLIFIIIIPIIVFIICFILLEIIGQYILLDRKTKACLVLTVGLCNLSFLGFPLTKAYYGEEGLQLAILCDQSGFMVVSTLGILIAAHSSKSGKGISIFLLLKKVISFPPTIGFILAFVLPLFVNLTIIEPTLNSLSSTMVPLALFSVGLQIQFKEWKADKKTLLIALFYKLILAPIIILGISFLFTLDKLYLQVGVLESAMAPMVTGSIIATEFNLKPKLSAKILSFGIPISFLTTYIWYLLLK